MSKTTQIIQIIEENPQKQTKNKQLQSKIIQQPQKTQQKSRTSNRQQHQNLSPATQPSQGPINQNKLLQRSRLECIIIQSRLRKLNQRISVEQQLIRNKKILEKLQNELRVKQDQVKQKKRQKIKQRIQQIERNKKQREQIIKQSDKTVAKLKLMQERKQAMVQKMLKNDQEQYFKCYEKALADRKKLLIPINFEELNIHERVYKKNRNRHRTQIEQEQYIQQEEDSAQKLRKIKRQTPNCSNRYSEKGSQKQYNLKNSSIVKMSVDQYLELRRKQEQRIIQLRTIRQRRQQYGDKVQRKFHKNRSKTESVQFIKQKQQKAADQIEKQINKRNEILFSLRKPKLPFETDINTGKEYEIKKIRTSKDTTAEEKLIKLNQMSLIQFSKVNVKGKSVDLDHLNKINMARAQILLGMQ